MNIAVRISETFLFLMFYLHFFTVSIIGTYFFFYLNIVKKFGNMYLMFYLHFVRFYSSEPIYQFKLCEKVRETCTKS